MARSVFFSFHYQRDAWRVQQVVNMGAVEGQPLLSSQKWEDVAQGGSAAIQKWIDGQMKYKTCSVVLIGSQTAGREWVEYEFRKAWEDNKGVMGIYIHGLADSNGDTSSKGKNPFAGFSINNGRVKLDSIIPVYDPAGWNSNGVYNVIDNNIEDWVDHAISVRKQW